MTSTNSPIMLFLLLSLVSAAFPPSVPTSPTFYFRVNAMPAGQCPAVQTFNDGNFYGPCTNNLVDGVQYNQKARYYVAINGAKQNCGRRILATYKNRYLNLIVMDECPGCTDGHLDMGLEALIELTGSMENACAINQMPVQITWQFWPSF